jgi:hypothetical protein
MADRRGDESLGPKRLCRTEDYTEPTLSSRVPAHLALRDCRPRGGEVSRIQAAPFGHPSVLVTAFWRRGKPRSGLKPPSNARPRRTALLIRSQNSELSDRVGVAPQLIRANVPAQLARPTKNGEPLPSRNRLLSRKRNSGKVVIHTISVSLVALGVSRSVQSTRCGHSHFTPRSHAPPASFALRRGRRVGSALNSLTRSRRTFSRTFIFVVPNSWPPPEEDRRPRLASHRKQRR